MDKKTILQMLVSDIERVNQESNDVSKVFDKCEQDVSNYIKAMLEQIGKGCNVILVSKTPKITRKKNAKIKVIPENEEIDLDTTDSSTAGSMSTRNASVSMDTSEIKATRAKRGASVKAADNIKKQQSTTLISKLRRPSNDVSDEPLAIRLTKENRRTKRTKEFIESSDEEIRPVKHSKIENNIQQSNSRVILEDLNSTCESASGKDNETDKMMKKRSSLKRKLEESFDENATITSDHNSSTNEEPVKKKANYSKLSPIKSENESPMNKRRSSKKQSQQFEQTRASKKQSEKFELQQTLKKENEQYQLQRASKKQPDQFSQHQDSKKQSEQFDQQRITRSSTQSIINAAGSKKLKGNNVINETLDGDETIASMYEDAVAKPPVPIMNSTMMNPNSTVTLEKAMNVTVLIEPLKKVFNETVTIKKNSYKEQRSRNSTIKETDEVVDNHVASGNQNNKTVTVKSRMRVEHFDALITDDESSPERKIYKAQKGKIQMQNKRITRSQNSSISDIDEIKKTPNKILPSKEFKASLLKSGYKQGALFSPYNKESVKKRVEAFEKAVGSPVKDEETVVRVTRTKTRALAAAAENPAPLTIAQKLARKSLAKAKKISLAKHAKESDDMKENENSNIPRPTKTKKSSLDRPPQKPQPKTTPLGKSRGMQVPGSASKIQYATPSNSHNLNSYSKTMTATRGNIVTHVDSFIQSNTTKSAQKPIDRTAEEKRKRAHEEDARRKREELLRAQAEEKRRKREEKELKNKLAREAKEKLEYEKRLKAEKEREEKAKLAQQMQEKQKEELERKRMAQIQRAHEKEERRKQEEQLRILRLQEQEEQERALADQKRREQELEKRRILTEMKMKAQLEKAAMQAKAKAVAMKQAPTSYKIDSDPDEEDSDDESKPKHPIPTWASKHVRQTQLAMQQHIPMKLVLKFFDAKSCTPDLRDLFHGIDPKKLKRSSSAIWKTPPRFSMMNRSVIDD